MLEAGKSNVIPKVEARSITHRSGRIRCIGADARSSRSPEFMGIARNRRRRGLCKRLRLAVGWSGGVGAFQWTVSTERGGWCSQSEGRSRGFYGARVAMPIMQMMAGKLGIAGFVGIGGGAAKSGDTTASKSVVPA